MCTTKTWIMYWVPKVLKNIENNHFQHKKTIKNYLSSLPGVKVEKMTCRTSFCRVEKNKIQNHNLFYVVIKKTETHCVSKSFSEKLVRCVLAYFHS